MKLIPGNNGEVYILTPTEIKYARHPNAPADKEYDVSGLGQIPRIIHQTWTTKQLPRGMQTAVDALKAANRGWEHRLYNDEFARRFIIKHFGSEVTWAYDTLVPGTYKADLFRYCVMYIHGGVYLDIKYAPVNGFSFESWLPNETYVLEFGPFVYQGCFMCPPRHPRLKDAIDTVVSNVRNGLYGDCHVCTTGPHMFGRLFSHQQRSTLPYIYRNNGVEVLDRKTGTVLLRQYDGYRDYQKETYEKAGTKYWSTMWQERSIFDMENFKSRHCPAALPITYNHEITKQMIDKLRTILDEKNTQLRNPVVHTYTYTDIIKGALPDVDTSIVPRLFWCSWNTNTLPPIMSRHMNDLMQSHPQFTLNVYSDNDCRRLISDYFTDLVVSAFDSVIPGAFKSDLWRYCALYVFGGIYFDVKFFPVNNFNYEEFITSNDIWVRDQKCANVEGIFNGFMVTKARNPFILEAIMKSCHNIHNKDYRYSFLAITGPHLLREAVPETVESAMYLGPRLEDNTNILYYGDRAVIKGYPEYRKEQTDFGKKHYAEFYNLRKVFRSDCLKHIAIEHDTCILRNDVKIAAADTIPRVIYQTWKTLELPPDMMGCVESLKQKHPTFEHVLFSDETALDFLRTYFIEDVVDAFQTLIPGAYKADLLRYCILYLKGGVYLDIKYNTADGVNLEDIIDKDIYVLENKSFREQYKCNAIYNALLASKPGCKAYLCSIIDIINNIKFKTYSETPIHVTGPALLGKYIHEKDCRFYYDGVNICDLQTHTRMFSEYSSYRKINNLTMPTHYDYLWRHHNIFSESFGKFKLTDIVSGKGMHLIEDTHDIPKKIFVYTNVSTDMQAIINRFEEMTVREFEIILCNEATIQELLPQYFTENVTAVYNMLQTDNDRISLIRNAYLYVYGGIFIDDESITLPENISSYKQFNSSSTKELAGNVTGITYSKPGETVLISNIWDICNVSVVY